LAFAFSVGTAQSHEQKFSSNLGGCSIKAHSGANTNWEHSKERRKGKKTLKRQGNAKACVIFPLLDSTKGG
jgi:hypothetical protein